MLLKWKLILSNWINCYFNEDSKGEKNLNIESLLSIISHLRENLNLDESKSSLLEAHTVEEFICDKYPHFKYEDGTFDAANEEKLCLSASLLLFFVCVNSKNFDMKSAMCSKLSSADQETILKYSKYLMECPIITVGEVQAAITEACGQDIAAIALPRQLSVTETPPVMRSLHNEVRRLQAALDAERFDRNYLQEELTRTNTRLERLLKEKEQHKLDVLNLKAKISLCCGEHPDIRDAAAASDKSGKLTRQLQLLEERLETTQAQLDDVQCERDTYKARMDELKHERDKWLSLSQQENSRVSQLSDELDTERRNVQSLRDLVAELQQHNKLNGLDTSSLECDDPDASIHSLQHNSSSPCEFPPKSSSRSSRRRIRGRPRRCTICSEVCANVVEVQLGEERTKVLVLKQQIQTLQDQINELTNKADSEKQTLQNLVVQRENDIFNLKHRINEEIEEKNNFKSYSENEITKLNNDINELEQKIKYNNEYSRSIIENKMAEIQNLQEEKLLLLHSLNNETTKLDNIIKDLKSELDSERQVRANMTEGYENRLMKLNEKVLNRNNELVELQNSIFKKGEQIETLQIELRNEKEALNELKNKSERAEEQKIAIEIDLRHKLDEVQNLHVKMQQNRVVIEDMSMEIQKLQASVTSLDENCKTLESVKEQLLNEIRNRDVKIEETLKDINHINEVFQNEKRKLLQDMDERNATVNSLQTQLQNEIQFKIRLQNELKQLHIAKTALSEDFEKLNSELSKSKLAIEDKSRTIDALDLYIQEEKKRNEQANERIQSMTHDIIQKEKEIQILKDTLESTTKSLQDEIQKNVENTDTFRSNLLAEMTEKDSLQIQFNSMLNEKCHIQKELSEKCEKLLILRDECDQLLHKLDVNESHLKQLEANLFQECQSKNELACQKNIEMKELLSKIAELKSNNEKLEQRFSKEIELQTQTMKTLQRDNEKLHRTIEKENSRHEEIIKEKNLIIDKLEQHVTDNIIKYEDLREHSENLNLLWENSEIETKAAAKEKECEIFKLKEMSLGFEQKINEVNQEKCELTKHIVELEESIKIMLHNQATETKLLKDTIELEKEKIIMENKTVISEKDNLLATLTQELTKERLLKMVVEKDNKKLLTDKEHLIQEKSILAQELDKDRSLKMLTDEEKNILLSEKTEIKHQLNKEMETTKTLLQEKDCLTQQLIEEKSAKEISEKEKNYLATDKELLEKRLIESEKMKSDICQEWENYKIETKAAAKEKEYEISQLREKSLIFEEKINEVNQNNSELTKHVAELEESMKIMLQNQATETKVLRDILELEKEKIIMENKTVISAKDSLLATLTQELTEEKLLKMVAEKENKKLLIDKEDLIQEKSTLAQELDKDRSLRMTAEDEKNVLLSEKTEIKHQLNKEMETTKTLLQEKDCLTQQLIEEKSAKEITEKEKNNLATDKELLEKRLIESEKMKSDICQEWENYKIETKAAAKEKEYEISQLREKSLIFEEKINEVNQNNSELTKHVAELEESMKIMLQNQATETKVLRDILELEKEKIIMENKTVISAKDSLLATLTQELTEEKLLKIVAEKENKKLLIDKEDLIQEKSTLAQELDKDRSLRMTAEDEKNVLLSEKTEIKHQLNKEMETTKTLLQEKDCLTQQLIEEKSAKEISEKEKNNLATDKELLDKRLIEGEKVQSDICQEWENYKIEMKAAAKEKEYEISQLREKLLIFEEKINEVNQNNSELTKHVAELEESMKIMLQNQATETKVIRDTIELEKEKIIMENKTVISEKDSLLATLTQELTEERLLKMVAEKENKKLLIDKEDLIQEKSTLAQELDKDRSLRMTAEEEKNILLSEKTEIKHQLNKEMETTKTLLQEYDCLTQQLIEEKSSKEISEKEKNNLATDKELLEKRLIESEKAKSDICQEIHSLNQLIDSLKQELTTEKKNLHVMHEINKSLRDELSAQSSFNENLLKENQSLINENDHLKKALHNANAAQDILEDRRSRISKELAEEKAVREKYEKELETQKFAVADLNNDMQIRALKKENEQLIRAIGQQATFTALSQEKAANKYVFQVDQSDYQQVDNSSSDNMYSSAGSLKTITDLETIIQDRNRSITSLQTDITYLKSLVADSETSLLDVKKELEVSKENCQELSAQLKKIVYQKNEEIAELKKQVTKMSVTENRASQIIKVSAKYQAIILKRVAEIKSNTILKELTNFGNSNDNELRRSLNAGTVTMEDLENFLDTTDRHLKRCSEKQIALQKERDRLIEVNRINESEIINLKKFLTELSVSFQTFDSMKDLYGHKLSRVVSVQRTVRREILNLDGRITDAAMCKLERGYGAAMQDLSECTMNLERWVERCISRTVSVEKIKQAFTSDSERSSLASPTFQNTGLEIQFEELEKSFQKLLEEVARAVKGESRIEPQTATIMEVRAEYEDKLNRMKAKMKDLFNEQMAVLKNKQREEIGLLERELQKTRDRMDDRKRAYENHIKELTKELWSVGEKYLVKNDEAEWLRKKQSGSLMSLQHVHSSGLVAHPELPSRPSDAHSLRSLPVVTENTKKKREGRGLHMSDEEGEVFDNRWLKELASTPRRDPPPGQRLSELKYRNSLCPPHLKSSYPAETQFAPILDEDEIKAGATGPVRSQRKEVGITAYKKPGPPTPSKQAGRLSATDSELRESLRVDNDPHAHADRKMSTPGRIRAFLRFNKNDTNEGTPRARRLSNIFRKK